MSTHALPEGQVIAEQSGALTIQKKQKINGVRKSSDNLSNDDSKVTIMMVLVINVLKIMIMNMSMTMKDKS